MPDGGAEGTLGVRLKQIDGHFDMEVIDDGPGMPTEPNNGSFGMKLVKSLARQLQAEIEWHDADPGTRVSVSMPNKAQ
jgi:two-component sensor histidine kinase